MRSNFRIVVGVLAGAGIIATLTAILAHAANGL